MASTRWANEQLVADHKDIQATSMAINASGRLAALGGRRCVALVDLDSPSVQKKVSRLSKWEVICSEWSLLEPAFYALGSGNCVEIYALGEETPSTISRVADSQFDGNFDDTFKPIYQPSGPLISLKGHTRTITDLNWSPFGSRTIATSSIDSNVLIWDIRDAKRPSLTFTSVASANQVKFNKQDENLLASSHDTDIRIWDRRRGNQPLHYIAAHLSKINCLDWSPKLGTQLASCSHDGSVKFWDLNVLKNKAEQILGTKLPAWRAKYTPFGSGIITAVVPKHVKRRFDHTSLYLWYTGSLDKPAYQFVGHSDIVIEFGWRERKASNSLELVTWSKDSSLRIWSVDQQIMSLVDDSKSFSRQSSFVGAEDAFLRDRGVEQADEAVPDATDTNTMSKSPRNKSTKHRHPSGSSMSKITLFDDAKLKVPKPLVVGDLQQEFQLININIKNLNFDEINSAERFAIISATSEDKSFSCRLKITFPMAYPNSVPPNFTLSDLKDLKERKRTSSDHRTELLKSLQSVAYTQVKRGRPCLEPCLRQFMQKLENLCSDQSKTLYPLSQVIADYSTLYSSFQDATVPFPRTSGGRFCGADLLVCFGRPPHLQQMSVPTEFTPRSLSDLSQFLSTNYRVVSISTPNPQSTVTSSYGLSDTGSDLTSAQMPVPVSNFYHDRSVSSQEKVRLMKQSSIGLSKKSHHASKKALVHGHLVDDSFSSKCGPVFIYDVEKLLPSNRKLGENYVFDSDVVRMCTENAQHAAALGRKDLVQAWNLAALVAAPHLYPPPNNDVHLLEAPWPCHPFGRKLITNLINHYLNVCGDVQTAAMLGCAFSEKFDAYSKLTSGLKPSSNVGIPAGQAKGSTLLKKLNKMLKPGNSPYHTVGGPVAYISSTQEPNLDEWNLVTAVESLRRVRSNSWSDSAENDTLRDIQIQPNAAWSSAAAAYRYHCNEMILLRDQHEAEQHEANMKMIDQELAHQLDFVKQIYAELLLRWGLHSKRALVLKYVNSSNNFQREAEKQVSFAAVCLNCRRDHKGVACSHCKTVNLKCSVCRVAVRGLTNFCSTCGHGGHATHLRDWFEVNDMCPSGCGCACLVNDTILSN